MNLLQIHSNFFWIKIFYQIWAAAVAQSVRAFIFYSEGLVLEFWSRQKSLKQVMTVNYFTFINRCECHESSEMTDVPCHSRCGTLKSPSCLLAMSASTGQNLQSLTGNGGSFIKVKISLVGLHPKQTIKQTKYDIWVFFNKNKKSPGNFLPCRFEKVTSHTFFIILALDQFRSSMTNGQRLFSAPSRNESTSQTVIIVPA